MKGFWHIVKYILYIVAVVVSVTYVVVFCANVSDWAQHHTDEQFWYAMSAMDISVLLALAMAIVNKIKSFDKKLFYIPLLLFACAVLTLIIAYNTPCKYCG